MNALWRAEAKVKPLSVGRKIGVQREIQAWATESTGFQVGAFVALATSGAGFDCATAAIAPNAIAATVQMLAAVVSPRTASSSSPGGILHAQPPPWA